MAGSFARQRFYGMQDFKYIIMAGGVYSEEETHRQLFEIHGEPIIARTIRLLQENGITDIAISSLDMAFDRFKVKRLEHDNYYICGDNLTIWTSAFYPTDYPVCYLFGDVVYSEDAIRKIIETDTDSIEYFASAPPYDSRYVKHWEEPFALKVKNTEYFAKCLEFCRDLAAVNAFKRGPIMWELWQVIKQTPLNIVDNTNYVVINDYTCDVDSIEELNELVRRAGL